MIHEEVLMEPSPTSYSYPLPPVKCCIAICHSAKKVGRVSASAYMLCCDKPFIGTLQTYIIVCIHCTCVDVHLIEKSLQ